MKNVLIAAAVLAMTATSVMAADLGRGFALNTDINAEYNVTAGGEIALTATPELAYTVDVLTLSVATDIDLADIDFVGFDLAASYDVNDSWNLYAEVSTDADLNFGDVVVGATVSF
jgi:hypothetical protein